MGWRGLSSERIAEMKYNSRFPRSAKVAAICLAVIENPGIRKCELLQLVSLRPGEWTGVRRRATHLFCYSPKTRGYEPTPVLLAREHEYRFLMPSPPKDWLADADAAFEAMLAKEE